ncbi:MAG: DUF134 domain-containing protein [Helicobacteraceae bacterium]|jgi:predicted DNA-binding protein (UPF0251 family)/predicted Fe-Mo cluster-binding NifX family protein|nr:DUF134 domain-containing protein [Helicobacteraceae bacterium]
MRGRKRNEATALFRPIFRSFFAHGAKSAKPIEMSQEEIEALRLADYEGLHHQIAADKLALSRPTFSRLLDRARKKTAEFLIFGKPLVIEAVLTPFVCAYCSSDRVTVADDPKKASHLVFALIEAGKIKTMSFEENPKDDEAVALSLQKAQVVIFRNINDKLKTALQQNGIGVIVDTKADVEEIIARL